MLKNSAQHSPNIYVKSVFAGLDEPEIRQKMLFAKLSHLDTMSFASEKLKSIEAVQLTTPLIDPQAFVKEVMGNSTIPLSITLDDRAPHLLLDDQTIDSDLPQGLVQSSQFQLAVQRFNQILRQNFIIFTSDLGQRSLSVENPINFRQRTQKEIFVLDGNLLCFSQAELEKLFSPNDEPIHKQMRSFLTFRLIAYLLKIQIKLKEDLQLSDYFEFSLFFDDAGELIDTEFTLIFDKILRPKNLSDFTNDLTRSYFRLRSLLTTTTRFQDADRGIFFPKYESRSVSLRNPEEKYFVDPHGLRIADVATWDYAAEGYQFLNEKYEQGVETIALTHRNRSQTEQFSFDVRLLYKGLAEDFYTEDFPAERVRTLTITKTFELDEVTKRVLADSIKYTTNSNLIELLTDGDFKLKTPEVPDFEYYHVSRTKLDKETYHVENKLPDHATIEVYYKKKQSQIVLKYLDLDAQEKIIRQDRLKGQLGSHEVIHFKTPNVYELLNSSGELAVDFPRNADEQLEIMVELRHKIKESAKSSTFTVTFVGLPVPRPHVQTIDYLERKDLVTGQVERWAEQPIVSFDAPQIKGYRLDDAELQQFDYDFSADDFEPVEFELHYERIPIEIPVEVLDLEADKVLESETLTGFHGEAVHYDWPIPEHYKLVETNQATVQRFDVEREQFIQLALAHRHKISYEEAEFTVKINVNQLLTQQTFSRRITVTVDHDLVTDITSKSTEDPVVDLDAPYFKGFKLIYPDSDVVYYDFSQNNYASSEQTLYYQRIEVTIPLKIYDLTEDQTLLDEDLVGYHDDLVEESWTIPDGYEIIQSNADHVTRFDIDQSQAIYIEVKQLPKSIHFRSGK